MVTICHHCPIFGDAGRFLRRLCIIWKSGRSWIPTSWLPASDHAHAVPWRPGESGGPGESSVKLWMGRWWKMNNRRITQSLWGFLLKLVAIIKYWIAAHYLWWPSTMFVCFMKGRTFQKNMGKDLKRTAPQTQHHNHEGRYHDFTAGTKCNCYHPVGETCPRLWSPNLQNIRGPSFRHQPWLLTDSSRILGSPSRIIHSLYSTILHYYWVYLHGPHESFCGSKMIKAAKIHGIKTSARLYLYVKRHAAPVPESLSLTLRAKRSEWPKCHAGLGGQPTWGKSPKTFGYHEIDWRILKRNVAKKPMFTP